MNTLSCPTTNCGGYPIVSFDPDLNTWQAACTQCGNSATVPAATRDAALANWNQQIFASPPVPAVPV